MVNESELDWLRGAPCLEALNVVTSKTHGDLSPLREHQGLKTLWLHGHVVADFDVFGCLSNLEEVMLGLADDIRSIAFVESMPNLASLQLLKMVSVVDLESIRTLTRLSHLELSSCRVDPELVLRQCPNIVHLIFDGSLRRGLCDIESILPRLVSISIYRGSIGNPALLARLTEARSVGLGDTDVTDLRPMVNLPKLREFELYGSPPTLDLAPLAALSQRVNIHLRRGQEVQGLDAVRGRHRIIRR